MPKVIDVVQGSEEWLAYKAPRVSGSNVWKVVAKGRGSAPSAAREELKSHVVIGKLTGKTVPTYVNDIMKQGTIREPQGRAEYGFVNDVEVKQYGVIQHPTIEFACSSPDGIIGDFEGGLEIKSPTHSTHLETLLARKDGKETIPNKYLLQMYWLMACAPELKWVDYVSYNPDYPIGLTLYTERILRTKEVDQAIADLEKQVILFLDEVNETVEKLRASYALQEAA